jgi:hypothetical protein
MADKPLFLLNDRHRLAYDGNQFIVQRRRGTKGGSADKWEAIAFVAHQKDTLWRLFHEDEILLTEIALKRMDALPETFETFLQDHDPEAYRRNPAFSRRGGEIRGVAARSPGPEGKEDTLAGEEPTHAA